MSQLLRISFYAKPDEVFNDLRRKYFLGMENMSDTEIAEYDISRLSFDKIYQLHIEASMLFNGCDTEKDFLKDENCDLALLEGLFKNGELKEASDYPWTITSGQQYRHFKGKIIQIIAVVKHTEYPTQQLVVYEELGGERQWARPLEMFCSKVDKEKYPDVKQEWRFELIEKP